MFHSHSSGMKSSKYFCQKEMCLYKLFKFCCLHHSFHNCVKSSLESRMWGLDQCSLRSLVLAVRCGEPGGCCRRRRGAWPCPSPPLCRWASSSCSSWSGGTRPTTRAPSKPSLQCLHLHHRSTCSRARWVTGALVWTSGAARCAAGLAPTPPCSPPPASSSATAASTPTSRPTIAVHWPGSPASRSTSSRSTPWRTRPHPAANHTLQTSDFHRVSLCGRNFGFLYFPLLWIKVSNVILMVTLRVYIFLNTFFL